MVLTTQPADGLWTSMPKSNNARQGRSLLASFLENADATPGNGTRAGVIVTTGLTIASDLLCYNVSGLNVDVAPGAGVGHLAGQGPMMGWLNAVKTVRCADPPASNPRNDIIIMRFYNLAAGDTSPDGQPCRLEIVTGTPGAVPVDPVSTNANGTITAIPAQAGLGTGGIAIPLGRAQVSTGGVITLTDIRKSAGVVGGPRFTLPGDAGDVNGRAGQMRYSPITDILEIRRSSGAWQAIPINEPSIARGRVAEFKSNVDLNVNTGTEQVLLSTTFAAVQGRRYQVVADFEYYQKSGTVATNISFHLRIIAGATPTGTAGTGLRGKYPNTPPSALFLTVPITMYGDTWVAPTSGTYAVSLSGKIDTGQGGIAGSGGATIDHTYALYVEDKGL